MLHPKQTVFMKFINPPWDNLTRIKIGFNHLKETKLGHNIEDCIELICSSGNGPKTTNQFFLHCINIYGQRQRLFNKITSIDEVISAENKNSTAYIVISKTKFPKQSVTSVMGIVLSAERFNASCFCARTNKIRNKILLNQNCE